MPRSGLAYVGLDFGSELRWVKTMYSVCSALTERRMDTIVQRKV
jgi:hypothetical protein